MIEYIYDVFFNFGEEAAGGDAEMLPQKRKGGIQRDGLKYAIKNYMYYSSYTRQIVMKILFFFQRMNQTTKAELQNTNEMSEAR